MQTNLVNPLAIAAISVILFAALVIGMITLSRNGGGAWGLDDSMSPEEAAQHSFEIGDHRLLGIRLTYLGKPGHELHLGANCWPESLNMIEYEQDSWSQQEPESGAHKMRAQYARQYNIHIASQLIGVGENCKFRGPVRFF